MSEMRPNDPEPDTSEHEAADKEARAKATNLIKGACEVLAKSGAYDATLDTLEQAIYELGDDGGEDATEFMEAIRS